MVCDAISGKEERAFAKSGARKTFESWLAIGEYFSSSEDPTVALWLAGWRKFSPPSEPIANK
jgi:hypothetical protein